MTTKRIRIFVSSPGDVTPERVVAERVIARLNREFAYFFTIEPLLWEHEPLRATAHFQDQIIPPSETDIVVVILWSRLGTRLPRDKYQGAIDGQAVSGTEWEFEEAAKAYRLSGAPDLMVYRKTAPVQVALDDEAQLERRRQQKKLLDTFIERWFLTESAEFKAAFWPFEATDQFEEMLDTHLRKLIRERLPKRGEGATAPTEIRWHQGSPFRGLESFDFEHSDVFFGRGRARAELREALATQAARGLAFVLVFGMSGSGKSSLVKAGLLPDLSHPGVIEGVGLCRWAVFRPGDAALIGDAADLYEGLAQAFLAPTALPELAAIGWDRATLAQQLRLGQELSLQPLRQALAKARDGAGLVERAQARIAVVVDQLEELFTLARVSGSERQGFVRLLELLARSGIAFVIATMRSDFFERLAELPELGRLAEGIGQYHLLPARPAEIGQMIRQPARAAGLSFAIDEETGLGLDAVIEEEAARDPGVLPLLEFTLDELFKLRSDNGELGFASYRRLGGIEGALARRAEEVFAGLAPSIQAALPAVLSALVTIKGGEETTAVARRVPLSEAATTPERRALIDALVAARLVVADRAEDGGAVVRVAHEALLTRWPRVAAWVAADRDFLKSRARVGEAAARWRTEGKSADLLLPTGRLLAEGEELLARRRDELDSELIDYIAVSAKAAQERRDRQLKRARILAAGFGAIAILAAGAGWIAFQSSQEASQQRAIAEEQAQRANELAVRASQERDAALRAESSFLAGLSLRLTQDGDPVTGMIAALEGLPAYGTRQLPRPLVASARDALYWGLLNRGREIAALRHKSPVVRVSWAPDGRHLLTYAGSDPLRLSDPASGQTVESFDSGSAVTLAAGVSQDSRSIIAYAADEKLRLFDVGESKPRKTIELSLSGHAVAMVAADAGLARAAVLYSPYAGRLIDLGSGQTVAELAGHSDVPLGAAFTDDGSRLLTIDFDQTARIWDGRDGHSIAVLEGHEKPVIAGALSPDGKLAATASSDLTVRLWEAETGKELGRFQGHNAGVWHLAFSPDGKRLVTASADSTARIWDVATRTSLATLKGHGEVERGVVQAMFSPDGQRVVTVGDDRTVRLWNAGDGTALGTVATVHAGEASAAFSPEGRRLATSAGDHTAQVWDVADPPPYPVIPAHDRDIFAIAFSPDGQRFITASGDKTVRLWESATAKRIAVLAGHKGYPVGAAFSRDGTRLVSWSFDDIKSWDLANEKLLATITGHTAFMYSVDLSPDGKRILSGAGDGSARLWDAETGKELGAFRAEGYPAFVGRFSPDASRAWIKAAGRVWIADGQTLAPKARLEGHDDTAVTAAFSPDGKTLLTGEQDGRIRLWDPESGAERSGFASGGGRVHFLRVLPDGQTLVTGSLDGGVRVQSLDGSPPRLTIPSPEGPFTQISVSGDGQVMAVDCADGTRRVYSLETGQEVIRLSRAAHGGTPQFGAPALSPDGRFLATPWNQVEARLVPVFASVEQLVQAGRRLAPRRLTQEERQLFLLSGE